MVESIGGNNMTQEDKDLLIKDLCARLPYGVKINIIVEYPIADIYSNINNNLMSIDISFNEINDAYDIENVKPYLFPMSSMTKEQKKEYFNICYHDWIDNKIKDIGEIEVLNKGIDWLNAHHFDYRGLIEKGLVIDATNLNIY